MTSSSNFRGLTAYKKAFALAMEIFQLSKALPKEEKYSLTAQIRVRRLHEAVATSSRMFGINSKSRRMRSAGW